MTLTNQSMHTARLHRFLWKNTRTIPANATLLDQLRVADPRTLRGCGESLPLPIFLKLVLVRPAKIGEGSMRQNEGFECRNRLAARTGSQPALRCVPDGTVLWLQCRAGRLQKTSLYAHPGLSYIAAGHH